MNTQVETSPWVPEFRWWVILAAVIAVGVIGNWAFGAGLLIFLLIQVARPFDFVTAFIVVVAGASIVANATGGLTLQLSLLTGAILLMLACYALSNRGRVFVIPQTTLTWPVLLFVALSLVNAARGLLAGYSRRNLGLELFPLLALGSCLLVANGFQRRRDLRLALVGLAAIGYGASARGFYDFAVTQHAHTKNSYTLAVPGMVALLFVNLALRSRTRLAVLGWSALSLPLFFEQFITFGRGLWTGCLAGIAVSAVIFGGFGPGSAARWRQAALVVGILVGAGVVGVIQVAVVLGQTELLVEAGTRLTSITGTQISYESRSNLIRLGEYLVVIKLIRQDPWLGHGVGYTFLVKQAFSHEAFEQWGVHQNFLMIWLKQGLLGLALFVWMLSAAVVLGAREARRSTDPLESTWFATTAAATMFLIVFSLSNYPFAVVNETFLLALLWGVAMAMTRKGSVSLRWSAPTSGTAGRRDGDRQARGEAGSIPGS